jgi:hypothetical protein
MTTREDKKAAGKAEWPLGNKDSRSGRLEKRRESRMAVRIVKKGAGTGKNGAGSSKRDAGAQRFRWDDP